MQFLKLFENSIRWKFILPAPLLMLVAIGIVWVFLPPYMTENVKENSILNAEQTVNQYKLLRSYYTINIISKVIKDGNLHPSIDHKNDPQGTPLPATMIHDLSSILKKENISLNLYSEFPFPNRQTRNLDVDIIGVNRKDEVGIMARAVHEFKVNALAQEALEKEAEELGKIATENQKQLDLNAEAKAQRMAEKEAAIHRKEEAEAKRLVDRKEMANRFEERILRVLETVSSAAVELNATSSSMNQSANSMKDESLSAATATSQAGQNVELVASSSDEMTASVRDLSIQISNVAQASKNALKSAEYATTRLT